MSQLALRALGGDDGLEGGVEERGLQRVEFAIQRPGWRTPAGRRRRFEGAVPEGLRGRGLQLLEREIGQKLLRGHLVVIAAIGPEELGEVGDLGERLRVDALRMAQNAFEQPLLAQAPDASSGRR